MKTYLLTTMNSGRVDHALQQCCCAGLDDVEVFLGQDHRDGVMLSTGKLLPGEVCCAWGHLQILRKIVAQDRPALVIEDDVEFIPRAKCELMEAYDFVHLLDRSVIASAGDFNAHWAERNGNQCTKQILDVELLPYCTTCYVISPKAAAYYLAAGTPIYAAIDVLYKYKAKGLVDLGGKVGVAIQPIATVNKEFKSMIRE